MLKKLFPGVIASLVLLAGSIFWPAVQQVEAGETGERPLEVIHSQNTNTVPLYEVFEITFKHERRYENPFFDVIIEVTFTAPSGRQVRVGGFHYGSGAKPEIRTFKTRSPGGERRRVEYFFEKQNLWKARFAPSEPGVWRYSYIFRNLEGGRASGEGIRLESTTPVS